MWFEVCHFVRVSMWWTGEGRRLSSFESFFRGIESVILFIKVGMLRIEVWIYSWKLIGDRGELGHLFSFFLFFGRMDEVDCFSFSIHASRRESISTLNFCIIPRVRKNEKNEWWICFVEWIRGLYFKMSLIKRVYKKSTWSNNNDNNKVAKDNLSCNVFAW